MQRRNFIIALMVCFILNMIVSCDKCERQKNAETASDTIVQNPRLKIVFIDASASFRTSIHHGEKTLFELSYERVRTMLDSAKPGEVLLIRAITQNSFGSQSFVAVLNLAGKEFTVKQPAGAGALHNWRIKKKKHDAKVLPVIDKLRSSARSMLDLFYANYKNKGTSSTDLCGALANVKDDITALKMKFSETELHLFSDLKYNTGLRSCGYFDASGMKVFLQLLNDTKTSPEYFAALKNNVKTNIFKNAAEINFFSPSQSIFAK